MHHSLLLATLLAACSTAPAPAPAKPAPSPAPAPVVVKPVVAKPALQRLIAGGLGGTPHIWGTRSYELRRVGSGASGVVLELRIHDETHFQGVGMRPDQMPPAHHVCSPWEPLPAAILVPPSATSCESAKSECVAIDQHLRATAGHEDPVAMHESMFGRSRTTCD